MSYTINDLNTYAQNTWCPGCGNFSLMQAFKLAVVDLLNEKKLNKEDIVIVTGIGCHGKMFDYLNLNGFYALHGRAIPTAEGIKLANQKLKLIIFVGDGDCYGEGLEHLIFAAKRNANITVVVHNNQNYALTTGQFTPVSPWGYKGKSKPEGIFEVPLNPIKLMLSSNASFVARGFAGEIEQLKGIFKEGIMHKGFSFIEVMQPEVTWLDTWNYYRANTYKIKDNHEFTDIEKAMKYANEFDYLNVQSTKMALGIFYKKERKTFEDLEKLVSKKVDLKTHIESTHL